MTTAMPLPTSAMSAMMNVMPNMMPAMNSSMMTEDTMTQPADRMPAMMSVMMARISCEMMPTGGMICTIMPMDSADPAPFQDVCQRMITMLGTGMPAMMMCGGQPMMLCLPDTAK